MKEDSIAHRPAASDLADALCSADWSGVSIGNKEMLKAVVIHLRQFASLNQSPIESVSGGDRAELRQAAAKVIDPVAFDPRSLSSDHPGWIYRRETALETANKILALLPASPPVPAAVGARDFCTSGPPSERRRQWIIYFDDQDKGLMVFDDEREAHEKWDKAKDNWTCTLFETSERKFVWAAGALRPIAALSASNADERGDGWQPIDTAPKDGKDFLAVMERRYDDEQVARYIVFAAWDSTLNLFVQCDHLGNGYEFDADFVAWQPKPRLPAPPTSKAG